MRLKIKICGMRESGNILEVAALNPDLIGFIFYPYSSRYAGEELDSELIAKLPPGIRRTGVFVNAGFDEILPTVRKYRLATVQLHGKESPELCHRLMRNEIEVIKAFNIKEGFESFAEFIPVTNYFLFDTPSKGYGGSGNKFNWEILDEYDPGHPFFLSGGIGPPDVKAVLAIKNPSFYGIDLNSRFELSPGFKNIESLKIFIDNLRLTEKSL